MQQNLVKEALNIQSSEYLERYDYAEICFDSVLNISQVLNTDNGRVLNKQDSKYATVWLNMSE